MACLRFCMGFTLGFYLALLLNHINGVFGQDYNVGLYEGCGLGIWDLNEFVFYATCKPDGEDSDLMYNNWMNLNECLTFDGSCLMGADNGNFWGPCNQCWLVPDKMASTIKCECGTPSATYSANLSDFLRDINGDLYCYGHRASKFKLTPPQTEVVDLPVPTIIISG